MSDIDGFRHFKPPGPKAKAYIADKSSMVKALLGPVGGGKTVTSIFDKLRRAGTMPACNDGIVRYRCAVIGSTYGQLERNLYPTWGRWLPRTDNNWTDGEWTGGGGRFATHRLSWDVLRGNSLVQVKAEYIFAAIGDQVVEEFMRGFEPTEFHLYEGDQLPEAVVDIAITRLGRYPATGNDPDAVKLDVVYQPQIGMDLNAPDIDSWFFQRFEEDPPAGFRVHKQPSGRSPHAENMLNLPAGYYDRQVDVLSKKQGGRNLTKRMVDAQYAPSQAGQPVYEEYDDSVHLAPAALLALPKVPLTIGFDQGLGQPAAIIGQNTPQGQSRILAEYVPGRMSARRFAVGLRELIKERFPGVPLAEVHYCDPAGFTGADKEDNESAWAEIVAAELDIVIVPTETNAIDVRLTAVVDDLTYMIEPLMPALLVSPACKMLRKGFVSHYMFEKRPDEKSQNRKPVKNLWANPHDALQYRQLGLKGRYGAIQGHRDPRAAERTLDDRQRQHVAADTGCHVLQAPVQF